jgi:hypothetical protein
VVVGQDLGLGELDLSGGHGLKCKRLRIHLARGTMTSVTTR